MSLLPSCSRLHVSLLINLPLWDTPRRTIDDILSIGKKTVMLSNPWGRGVKESYEFDVTKSDKLFDFLLEKGQIKLPKNHVMLPPDQLKNKKFYKFHNATSHFANECRVFQQHIYRAIQQGRLKFDTP